jgi:hypothetical protein
MINKGHSNNIAPTTKVESTTDNCSSNVIEIDRTQYENLLQGKFELSAA